MPVSRNARQTPSQTRTWIPATQESRGLSQHGLSRFLVSMGRAAVRMARGGLSVAHLGDCMVFCLAEVVMLRAASGPVFIGSVVLAVSAGTWGGRQPPVS